MSLRNRYQIRKRRKSKEQRPWPALVGDGAGTIEVPGNPNLWYVRPIGSNLPIPVYRGAAPRLEGYPVWVGQDVYNRRWVRILGTNLEALAAGGGGSTTATDIEPHAPSHFANGSDPVYIADTQVVNTLCYASTGMTVHVNGGWVVFNGTPVYISSTDVDMTTSIPTGAAYSLIRVNSSGVVSVQDGTPVDSFADLTTADVPTVADNYLPIAVVRLYENMTALSRLTTNPDVIPLHLSQVLGGGAVAAADVAVDTTDFDGILSAADSDAQTALETIDDHTHDLDNHDHSGDAGDGGTFDAANLTSGAAGDGQVLTADGSGGAAWEAIPTPSLALDDLSDVNTTGKTTGDVIYNNAGTWEDYPLGIGAQIVVDSSKIKFGNVAGGSYMSIDLTTGNVRLLGDATVFEDLRIDGLTTRTGVVSPTDETGFRGSANFYVRNFVHNQADEVQFDVQLPHAWLEGGELYPHVHFSPWISSTGDKAAQFILEYYFANVNEQFPASPSTYTMTKTWNGDQQWYHLIAGNASALTATGKKLSSILKCRLYRDNTVTNNLAGKVTFLYFDIHCEINAFGSDEEYIKDSSAALLLESGDYLLLESGDNLLTE